MTINKNFKSRPERLNFIHLLYFSLSGLDLRFLFIVTGAHYESGLFAGVLIRLQYYTRARLLALHRISPERFECPNLTDEVVRCFSFLTSLELL